MERKSRAVMILVAFIAFASVAQAQNVKITPIGLRTGEFCALDRALLFEDPTGVRILYDPGNSTAGAGDSRLGNVHAILVTHAHGDHLGAVVLDQNPDAEQHHRGNCSGEKFCRVRQRYFGEFHRDKDCCRIGDTHNGGLSGDGPRKRGGGSVDIALYGPLE